MTDGVAWSEAAIAIAAIVFLGSVIAVVVWQLLATWRARMTGQDREAYRKLAERATEAQERSASGLEQAVAELGEVRERTSELERMLKEVE